MSTRFWKDAFSFLFLTFSPHQHDKEKMLKNPHPLGLEVKIAEQEQVLAEIKIFYFQQFPQGVVHSPVEGQVTVTSGPSQPKTFQLVLTNTRLGTNFKSVIS